MKVKTEAPNPNATNKNQEQLIEKGIPVSRAVFHSAVNNGDDTPENEFSMKSAKSGKRVKMLLTPHGLMCDHKERHFFVPLANIIFMNLE